MARPNLPSGDFFGAASRTVEAGGFRVGLWIASRPPDWRTSPCTMERPSPVPLPMPLVVKNGSAARASVASSMPSPLSMTARRT